MEIKFRGKRIDNGEWIYGYLFQVWEKTYILWGTTNDVPNMHEVISETVGQYTGLNDKNGKEIYEGDILKYKFNVLSGVDEVVFTDGIFRLKNDYISEAGFRTVKNVSDYCEVLGSRFDNPELLTQ